MSISGFPLSKGSPELCAGTGIHPQSIPIPWGR